MLPHLHQLACNKLHTCQTANYVRKSYDILLDILECIENFTRRLKIYAEIQPSPSMTETIIKIMVELLAVLSLATEEMKQGKLSESLFSSNTHDVAMT
jgi:hypothetical protein